MTFHIQVKAGLKRIGYLAAFGALASFALPAAAQQTDSASILIYDASGSMWGQLDGGVTKVEVARKVIGDFFVSRDNTVPLGVIAYGHNRRGDCSDIQVIANVGINSPSELSTRLNRLNPRGMTPITDSLALAASMIPPTAETADIILVTDGLETCEADPCALAAQLAQEGIAIRAHVVGFGLTSQEAAAMSCVADATGGLLLTPQTGQELADALNQIAQVEPTPTPEPLQEAFFDIGPKAEAGHTYSIAYQGSARPDNYAGFTLRGEGRPSVSSSFGVVGGAGEAGNNPFSQMAPTEPGEYDLIMIAYDGTIIARQPIEVVPPSNGFDAIGSVEPEGRFQFTWRGPNQLGQRIVIARPGAVPNDYQGDWGYPFSNAQTQTMRLTAPAAPGIYELRYITSNQQEILFSREFGVGVPFEDAGLTNTADLAARAAAATRAEPGQDAMPMVRATFRIPDNFPQIPLWWDAIPLDPDMMQEAYAPISEFVVWDNPFEPGRYRVSATGPGEVEFSAVVEIYPGQDNNFIIPPVAASDEEAAATTLTGPWQVIGVPPYQVQARADQLLFLVLEQSASGAPIGGSWVAAAMLAGPQAAGREGNFTQGAVQDGAIRLIFTVGEPVSGPMTLYLTPYGIGYAGSLSSGSQGMSVIMWPDGYELPSLSEMRAAVHGPAPADFVDTTAAASADDNEDSVAFHCTSTPAGCPVNHAASGISLTLPNNWSMSEPYFYETAGGARADVPTATFFSEEFGQLVSVELNPRQWPASNGVCRPIGSSELCTYAGQGMTGDMGFELIHASLAIVGPDGRSSTGDNPLEDGLAGMLSDPMEGAATDLLGNAMSMGATEPALAAPNDAIRLVLNPTDQFGSACFINAAVSNPTGEAFTLLAPINATANGRKVSPVINPETPAMLEVSVYSDTGASLTPIMLISSCNTLVVSVGPVKCRMGVGDQGTVSTCPVPLEVSASPEFADLYLVGEQASAAQSPAMAATSGGIIPVDLAGRDPAAVLRALFSKQLGN